ncbi:hypothetical protein NDU88_010723 [Pleurodeles waltl]|uniref:Uncharacterized protein n=1 Tax=Pleurodeles waltl TaxID=8319 RepID=A0AAV7S1Z9_PLEWA|nr:hypothetical protein NDU88_010723 [Pleurodeles waltl]
MDRSGQRNGQSGDFSKKGPLWLKESGLADLWRLVHPDQGEYTFCSAAHKTYAHIDHFLCAPDLQPLPQNVHIDPMTLSDQAPISLTLRVDWKRMDTGSSWSVHNKLIQQPTNMQAITSTLMACLQTNDTGEMATPWEALKLVIRAELMVISANDSRIRQEKRAQREDAVEELELSTSGREPPDFGEP